MPTLYAIADLHLTHKFNLEAFQLLKPHPGDSLIIAGDVGERLEHLHQAFTIATKLFKQVIWTPGNHELWSLSSRSGNPDTNSDELRGEFKYLECVRVANEYGVITPEDEYITWDDEQGSKVLICPIFTLYDYSFRPENVSRENAVNWALEHNVQAVDETILHPDPYPSRDEWCHALIAKTEERLAKAAEETGLPLIIINHWPLREDLITIPSIPRFTLWCGSKLTENWHKRFNAKVIITGHLHVRRTDWRDGTRFEECSLGYPKQWEGAREIGKGVNEMLRVILPEPEGLAAPGTGTMWRRNG